MECHDEVVTPQASQPPVTLLGIRDECLRVNTVADERSDGNKGRQTQDSAGQSRDKNSSTHLEHNQLSEDSVT